jgi:ABC-type dipeptide/oligopeptide/nickel transport system permease component
VLGALPMSSMARVTGTTLANLLKEDFVRAAHAKGLTHRRVILVHVLRNALPTILSFLGPALMEMFIGLFIIENLYGFPGIGREYWQSVIALDYPMIMGLTLLSSTGIALINILIEILCALLDPRIRMVGMVSV